MADKKKYSRALAQYYDCVTDMSVDVDVKFFSFEEAILQPVHFSCAVSTGNSLIIDSHGVTELPFLPIPVSDYIQLYAGHHGSSHPDISVG